MVNRLAARVPAWVNRVRVPVPRVLAWLIAAPFALWALARAAGLDGVTPLAQLMAFTPYVATASLVALVLALLGRRFRAAALAAATCVTFAVCVLPRAFGASSTMEGVPVAVMSMNTWEGRADVASIVELVRRERIDVLALQEFTPDAERRLAEAGIAEELPYQANHAVDSTPGSGLYSRYPLTDTGNTMNAGGFNQVRGVVQLPGAQPLAVESAHPIPPALPSYVPLWRQDLRDQPPAPRTAPPLVLIGDFNATLDHSNLRRLIATGYADAADAVGKGFTPTWPYAGPRSAVTPKVTIDHALVDARIGVSDFAAFTIPNTDHRAIIARLTLPRA